MIQNLNERDTPTSTEARTLGELSPQQWKSGLAAWLGWMFDGLDMHLYTLVAAPFVAGLLAVSDTKDPRVGWYSSVIQAGFLLGKRCRNGTQDEHGRKVQTMSHKCLLL